jgi:hypothetical protein
MFFDIINIDTILGTYLLYRAIEANRIDRLPKYKHWMNAFIVWFSVTRMSNFIYLFSFMLPAVVLTLIDLLSIIIIISSFNEWMTDVYRSILAQPLFTRCKRNVPKMFDRSCRLIHETTGYNVQQLIRVNKIYLTLRHLYENLQKVDGPHGSNGPHGPHEFRGPHGLFHGPYVDTADLLNDLPDDLSDDLSDDMLPGSVELIIKKDE